MNKVVALYRLLPEWFVTTFLIISNFLAMLVIVLLHDLAQNGGVVESIFFWGWIVCYMTALTAPEPFKRWQYNRWKNKILRQREERVQALFAGKSREFILNEAPFGYDRSYDCDSCFLIYHKHLKKIVNSESSPREAELWILEQFLTSDRELTS